MSKGIVLMCAAMFVMACMDAISKYLVQTYPVTQMLAVRFTLFTAFAILVLSRGRVRTALRTAHPWLQLLRGLVITCEVAVFVLAFSYLPLADVHAIGGVAPLLVTALAAPLLGEHIGPRRWAAVAGGFVGLLIIIRPGITVLDPAALIPLGGALLWAIYQILVRRTSDDSAGTQMLYMAVVGAVVMGAVAPFQWVAPDAVGWAALVALGVVGSLAHWLLIRALQSAPASGLQPYHYSVLVWAALLGYLFFDDIPDPWTGCGALVIVASALYAWYRERQVRHQPSRAGAGSN